MKEQRKQSHMQVNIEISFAAMVHVLVIISRLKAGTTHHQNFFRVKRFVLSSDGRSGFRMQNQDYLETEVSKALPENHISDIPAS